MTMRQVARCFALSMVVFAAFGGSVPAQGATTPGAGLPPATAPLGVGDVRWPSTAGEIEALLARLPPIVAGEPRVAGVGNDDGGDRSGVSYGDDEVGHGPPLVVQVIDVSTGDFWPAGWSAERVVLALADGADWMVEAAGRDGDLVWIRWRTTSAAEGERPGTPEVRRDLHTISWGRVGEPWLFGAAADSPARLEALVLACVAAASTEATPAP
jgi:hypothetical protein